MTPRGTGRNQASPEGTDRFTALPATRNRNLRIRELGGREAAGTEICRSENCGDGNRQDLEKSGELPRSPPAVQAGGRASPADAGIIRNAQVHGSPQKKHRLQPTNQNCSRCLPLQVQDAALHSKAVHPRSGLKFRGRFLNSRRAEFNTRALRALRAFANLA